MTLLLRLFLVTSLSLLVLWQLAPPERQDSWLSYFLDDASLDIKTLDTKARDSEAPVPSVQGREKTTAAPISIEQQVAGVQQTLLQLQESGELQAHDESSEQQHCFKAPTRELEKVEKQQIYQWRDEQGKLHFGDKRRSLNHNAEDLGDRYKSRQQYFTLSIVEQTKNLPAFTQDRITAEVTKIYQTMAASLSVGNLRQIDLAVRVIGSREAFAVYRNKVAPGLQTTSGFYSGRLNEASVWQNKNPELMRSVIRHESTHVIMAGLYGNTPTWFNEGLSEYFEVMAVSGQAGVVAPPSGWFRHLKKMEQQRTLPSLKAYLALTNQQWRQGKQSDQYAVAWGLVHMLLSNAEGKQFVRDYMNALAEYFCRPFSTNDYLEKHYPGGLARLQKDWDFWLYQASPSVHVY